MKYLAERSGITRIFFGGDFITHSDPSKQKMKALAQDFSHKFRIEGCSFYPMLGNHDDNSYEQSDPEAVFSLRELEVVNALMSAKPGSRIIVFAHIWVEWDRVARKYFPNPKTGMLLNMFDAFNARRTFGQYDFSACTSRVILVMGGHIHNNYMTFTDGGIPVVLSDSDSFAKSCNRSRIIPFRQSISAVIVQSEDILIVKIGRGCNRTISRRI